MASERETGGEIWGLVLAGGDGTRLAAVARDAQGAPAPKQYCALAGDDTLFARTVGRLSRLVPRRRLLAVVAERHRPHWRRETELLPEANWIVQPENRGTAAGILLPLLAIAERDPDARVVISPSDHHVGDVRARAGAIAEALSALERPLDRVLLLGISPDTPDGELGWILPRPSTAGAALAVERFVEKPGAERARALAREGAVWNSFLMVARVSTLIDLFRSRRPELLTAMESAFVHAEPERGAALARLYAGLPAADFSREVLEGAESRLGVVVAPPCGWTDLGTPDRLRRCRDRHAPRTTAPPSPRPSQRRPPGNPFARQPALALG